MSLFGTALGPRGKGSFSLCLSCLGVGCTSCIAAGCGMGMPGTGWSGKTKNHNKNKPQVSATCPCNRPKEETAGDGQAGCTSQGGKAIGTQLRFTMGGGWAGAGEVSTEGWRLLASGFAAFICKLFVISVTKHPCGWGAKSSRPSRLQELFWKSRCCCYFLFLG